MTRFVIIISLLLASIAAHAESVLVQGNAFSYRGKMLEVKSYSDLFTFKSQAVANTYIAQDGSFKITFDAEETNLYLIKIGKVNAHLFVEPGSEYTLVIPEPFEADKYGPAKDVFVQPEIFESEGKLNQTITKLEAHINRFIIDNTHMVVGKGIKAQADSFLLELHKEFDNETTPYFKEYFHYRLASFEIVVAKSRTKVFETYFQNQPLAYHQLSFSNAFSLLFDEYFEYISPSSAERFTDSVEADIRAGDLENLRRHLAADPLLQNEELRDLLIVTQIFEIGQERTHDHSKIIKILDDLVASSDYEPCKTIALNAKEILNILAKGTRAPDFEFADAFGNIYRLSEYEGRYIYIQFFDRFTPETLKEMSLMQILKDGYGSEIALFSITTTESQARIKQFQRKYGFEWVMGKAQSPDQLIQDYQLRALPTYFYLDKDLNIVKAPAPPPGARIEKTFARAWNEEHPDKALRFKLQPPKVDSLGRVADDSEK